MVVIGDRLAGRNGFENYSGDMVQCGLTMVEEEVLQAVGDAI